MSSFKGEAGMVTAETAVTIPALLAVFALMIAGVSAATSQGQACHAARTAARAVSIGMSDAQASSLAVQSVSRGANVSIAHARADARVTVAMSAGALLVPIRCSVTTQKESSFAP
ncbi:TadE family type IV pilus minor pilin [uncultured Actinomyces sp.]|uniref:TadE family type IV pilus minor pilin n=1 Tax=uncultured Actinomyces sp. TaxID=249061 RepID=UPI0026294895|nr:TadE family type IV pilus minor pilin [uncultured Actinomyces sp.]